MDSWGKQQLSCIRDEHVMGNRVDTLLPLVGVSLLKG